MVGEEVIHPLAECIPLSSRHDSWAQSLGIFASVLQGHQLRDVSLAVFSLHLPFPSDSTKMFITWKGLPWAGEWQGLGGGSLQRPAQGKKCSFLQERDSLTNLKLL